MKTYKVTIRGIEYITHNVLKIITEKPSGFNFEPGQATEVALNRQGWREEFRPFTFTNLPNENYLEFMIKIYPDHKGVTNMMKELKAQDVLTITEPFGAIIYSGPGVFIAGGAGITPFISILRSLRGEYELHSCSLIFANKSTQDIIRKDELNLLLQGRITHVLSEENKSGFKHGHIDKTVLKEHITHFDQTFYVCGTPKFTDSVLNLLSELGVNKESVVMEL